MRYSMGFSLVLSSILFWSCIGSTSPFTWGKVNQEVLNRIQSPHDSSAVADILFEIGSIELMKRPFLYTLNRHVRYQIYSDGGKQYADIKIPYYHKNVITGIEAKTYLPDGTIIKLKQREIFTEGDKTGTMYKVFAIPGVVSNCVIEYKYQMTSEYLGSLRPWIFQNDLHTEYSKLSVEVPRGFKYSSVLRNPLIKDYMPVEEVALKPNNEKAAIYTWEFFNIPPFVAEPYMTAKANCLTVLNFQLVKYKDSYFEYSFVSTWDDLGEKVSNWYKPYFRSYSRVDNFVDELIVGAGTREDKIDRLYSFVRDSIVLQEDYWLYNEEKNRAPKKIINDRTGSKVEKNLVLLNMLRSIGVKANPVLISTRKHGSVNRINPRLNSFNHVIVHYKDRDGNHFLDTQLKYCPNGMLPAFDINKHGFLIKDDDYRFIDIPDPQSMSMLYTSIDGELNGEGTLTCVLTQRFEGYRNMYYRRKLDNQKDDKKFVEDYLINNVDNAVLDSFKVINRENILDPLLIITYLHIDDYVDFDNDILYLDFGIYDRLRENKFKLEERKYPIDYNYPRINKENVSIRLPAGLKPLESPPPAKIVTAGHSYNRVINISVNRIKYEHQLVVANTVYNENYYNDIKGLYTDIVDLYQDQIVLTKQ